MPVMSMAKRCYTMPEQPQFTVLPNITRKVCVHGMEINISESDEVIKRSASVSLPIKQPIIEPQLISCQGSDSSAAIQTEKITETGGISQSLVHILPHHRSGFLALYHR